MKLRATVGLVFIATLTSTPSLACKRTASSGEIAARAAILKSIETAASFDGFEVVSIEHDLDRYVVHLRKAETTIAARFDVTSRADCQVEVERLGT